MKKILKVIAIVLGGIILIAVVLGLLSKGSNQSSIPSQRMSNMMPGSVPMSAGLGGVSIMEKSSVDLSESSSPTVTAPAEVEKKVIKNGSLSSACSYVYSYNVTRHPNVSLLYIENNL